VSEPPHPLGGAAGVLSVILGADNYWDLRYYHLYAPWAYLHDRYLYDLGPAQAQGFLIPVADLLLYGLISSPLNEAPRGIAFIMGAVHGVNAALLLAIVCHVIRPPDATGRFMLRAVAWLMGVTGGGFVPLIGTPSNDLTSSMFVFAALLALLKAATPPPGRAATAAFATASDHIPHRGAEDRHQRHTKIPGVQHRTAPCDGDRLPECPA
jgi:hypothetical protein